MTELLTVDEVAQALTLHRRTVTRLIEAGRIRIVRPSPGRIAVTRRELEAYMASISRAGVA